MKLRVEVRIIDEAGTVYLKTSGDALETMGFELTRHILVPDIEGVTVFKGWEYKPVIAHIEPSPLAATG